MKKSVITILIMILSLFSSRAKAEKAEADLQPDFDFPATVVKNAGLQLDKAVATGNVNDAGNALLQLAVAETLISPDSLPAVIKRTEILRTDSGSAVMKSVMALMEASFIDRYYQAHRWQIENNTAVEADSADISLWARSQFEDAISRLCLAAMTESPKLLKTLPETDFPGIISRGNEATQQLYSSLLDFVGTVSLRLLSGYAEGEFTVEKLISGGRVAGINTAGETMQKIVGIWLSETAEGTPERVGALLSVTGVVDVIDYAEQLELYEANKETPYSVLLLITPRLEQLNYRVAKDFLKENPDFLLNENVVGAMARLETRKVELTFPRMAAPGRELTIKAEVGNTNEFEVEVYYSNSYGLNTISNWIPAKVFKRDFRRVATLKGRVEGEVPFNATTELTYTPEKFGCYAFLAKIGKASDPGGIQIMRCTNLATLRVAGLQKQFFAVDLTSGAPQANVRFAAVKEEGYVANRALQNLVTGKDGKVVAPEVDKWYSLRPEAGSDRFSCSATLDPSFAGSASRRATASVNTSLGVYHPGDEIEWTVAAATIAGDDVALLSKKKITVRLTDVNNQEVGKTDVTTDEYGRASGKFNIPESGLTGYFRIIVEYGNEKYIGGKLVMVSDYKLPTFEVKIDTVNIEGGKLQVKGSALTYAGFPVAVSEARLTLTNYEKWSWWRSTDNGREVLSTPIAVNDEGNFEWTVALDSLNSLLPYPDGLLKAQIDVVSLTGESHGAETETSLSKGEKIMLGYMADVKAGSDVTLPIRVVNPLNQAIEAEVEVTLTETKSLKTYTLNVKVNEKGGQADLSGVPSGSYRLKATVKDSSEETDVVIYRDDDKESPSAELLWSAQNRIEVGSAGKAIVRLGTIAEKSYVLMTVSAEDKIINQKWIELLPGMHSLEVELPGGLTSGNVSFLTVNNGRDGRADVALYRPDPASQLKVKIENLRAVTTSGKKETMKIVLADGNGAPLGGAAILDIYCKAMDAVEAHGLSVSFPRSYQRVLNTLIVAGEDASTYFYLHRPGKYGMVVGEPSWLYGDVSMLYSQARGIFVADSYANLKIRGSSMMSKAVLRENAVTAMADTTEDCAVEEEAEIAYLSDSDGGENGMAGAESAKSEPEYRPSEVPLALFAPDLTIGDSGELEVSWTVPDANTTWALNLLAWDTRLQTAKYNAEIISSKPIMVSANAPRFLRRGDKVEIVSVVNNATDSIVDCIVKVSFINPFNGEELESTESMVKIDSRKSSTVSSEIAVGDDWNGVVMKVSATAGNFTDAEMHTLPVLANSQPVIDATTFYLSPSQQQYKTDLGKEGTDAKVTLSFTANAVWSVVTALPGMRSGSNVTSPAAADNLFSLMIARGVMEHNPEIAEGLAKISKETPEGSLSRDNALAQLNLSSTPWVEAAAGENERLARLYAALDATKVSEAIVKTRADLKEFVMADGGFRWSKNSDRSSTWATERVLSTIAWLIETGFATEDDFNDISTPAMAYLQRDLLKQLERDPLGYDLTFARLCTSFAGFTPSATAKRANERAIKAVVDNRKNRSIAEKAEIAKILYRTGHKAEAKEMLASLSEFSTYNPAQGRFFDGLSNGPAWARTPLITTAMALSAYAMIAPDAPEIDQLRQWLVLTKATTGWGDTSSTSAAVAAILESGARWTTIGDDVKVTIGGEEIELNQVDRVSGTIVAALISKGGEIAIERKSKSPAWGAITVESVKPMRTIKAHSTSDLSIEKQILAKRDGKWIVTDKLTQGETVKVRLIVTTKRITDYVTIVDNRPAAFEPAIMTPRVVFAGGLPFYLENRDASTDLFIDRLPKGRFVIEYEMKVNNRGDFSAGVATLQCAMTPEFTAHSASVPVTVE